MVRLLAELFDAELVSVPETRPSNAWRRVTAFGPRRRRGREICIVVAAEPRLLNTLLRTDYWIRGYRHVVGWVIDSFWVDRIPVSVRHRDHFDRLFVADKEVVDLWSAETDLPVSWLPWGADVLRLGSPNDVRPVDLQRVGRQPPAFEDDERTRRACEAAGLRFEGRPSMHDDATVNQAALMQCLSLTKFVLAFSNKAAPASYTHPTREYLTGRWTDSLASGAVVAGIAPRCAATTELLWPGATLDLQTTELLQGIEQIAEAVRTWDPEIARENHRRSLAALDWRWRFRELADALDLRPARLDVELESVAALLDR